MTHHSGLDLVLDFLLNGITHATGWQILLFTLAVTHITIAGVTIFLHRCQAHRALDLHAIPSHFFRFWLWMTTGMVTKEWAAIHRKHHAKCETVEDPHSPITRGKRKTARPSKNTATERLTIGLSVMSTPSTRHSACR